MGNAYHDSAFSNLPRGRLVCVCGRYAASRSPEDLAEEFEVERVDVRERVDPSWNVAPTDRVYAVLSRPPREDRGAPAQRRLTVVRWGLVPGWARDAAAVGTLINARVETVATKPAFRRAFAVRRCLLPADGYYEWYGEAAGPGGRRRKQPWFIRPRDGGVLAMAGLYEIWRDHSLPEDHPQAFRWSAAVLTTTATDEVGRLHDRMPLLVEPGRYAGWLDPGRSDPDELRGLLVPAAPGRLEAHPVSTQVNDVRRGGRHLVDPLPPTEDPRRSGAGEAPEGALF